MWVVAQNPVNRQRVSILVRCTTSAIELAAPQGGPLLFVCVPVQRAERQIAANIAKLPFPMSSFGGKADIQLIPRDVCF
jgi:hypothetical protein